MDICCSIVVIIILIFVFVQISISTSEKEKAEKEKRERAEKEKKARRSALNTQLYGHQVKLGEQEREVKAAIKGFFSNQTISYSSQYSELERIIDSMYATIKHMKNTNNELKLIDLSDDRGTEISQMGNEKISRARTLAEKFQNFGKKVHTLSDAKMVDVKNYGHIEKQFWDSVCSMQRKEALQIIDDYAASLASDNFDKIFSIDLEKVLRCIWYFALEKNFSSSDFRRANNVFASVYKSWHVDPIIADLYARNRVGGEDALRETLNHILDSKALFVVYPDRITNIASALMWMKAYQSENIVLQYMLAHGINMPPKVQERLHSLTNGGGKAPSGFDVKSSVDSLYFDVSALAWRDDEYVGMFENLAFQDKSLTYSLALRDEDKDLFIPQGIQLPGTDVVLNKFRTVFDEEYGTGVKAQAVSGIALSGSGEERLDGILVSASDCKQLGIFIHIARIGKKLIIKFYTLFMPMGNDLAVQKQQALSMYKKLSPSVTMWEGSLKDTMLMAVEQLLNGGVQSATESVESSDAGTPIF